MAGDPETRNVSPELLSTHKKPALKRLQREDVKQILGQKMTQNVSSHNLHDRMHTTALQDVFLTTLWCIPNVWADIISFLVILRPFLSHQF